MGDLGNKTFLGVGTGFPLQADEGGALQRAGYEDSVRQSVWLILGTAKGERVMRPDFGCGIHDLVFAAMDSETLQRVRSTVEDALRRFEARIEVVEVNVIEDLSLTDGRLQIEVDYRIRRTNQIGNLVFPFYFREGGQR